MSRVRGWDLIYWLLTVGEWHGPDCSLSRVSHFIFSKKYWGKTLQRLSQGPQAATYIRGWGRRHGQVNFLPVTLLAYCPLGSLAVAVIAMNVLSERRGFKDTAVAIGLVDTRHLHGYVSP